jgi:eukaryotic-like serine/threonine-protein kinase
MAEDDNAGIPGPPSPPDPDDQQTGPLSDDIASGAAFTYATPPRDPMPSHVGRYRIQRELGRGGMGMVYVGVRDDVDLKQRVAIKVIRRGMDTDDVLRRFAFERKVLSALNHPNIARLYDGGSTDDGRPYFAMELVEGLPIDRYCDRNKLSIDERLKLFRQVCSAVAYAHRNLVVHRDIKPANIIVTIDGVPKLLDFGIAKLLNPAVAMVTSDLTSPDLRIMTPEYASPEQVRGEQITTASDVYSLGVLLYELLTGHRPYHIKERVRAELERIICEEEPERPSTAVSRVDELPAEQPETGPTTVTPEAVSKARNARPDTLRRRLAGDLDNIVLMAMRKEPQRRYTSVERFVEDIERHQSGMPVSARPSSFSYRAVKFVRRNRAGIAVAALVALTVLGGLTSLWQYEAISAERARAEAAHAHAKAAEAQLEVAEAEAEMQRITAEERLSKLRHFVAFTLDDVDNALQRLEGGMEARRLLLTSAFEHLHAMAAEADDDPAMRRELAAGYTRMGNLLGGVRGPSMGDTEGALASFREALRLRLELLDQAPHDGELLEEVWSSRVYLGDVLRRSGDTAGAGREYHESLAVSVRLLGDPPSMPARRRQAVSLLYVGDALRDAGDHVGAMNHYEQSLALRRALLAEAPADATAQRDVSVGLGRIGAALVRRGDLSDAVTMYRESLELRQRLYEVEPDARTSRDFGRAAHQLCRVLLDLGETAEARRHLATYRTFAHQRAVDNPLDFRAQLDLMLAYDEAGRMLAERGDYEGALESYRTLQTLLNGLIERDTLNTLYPRELARSYAHIGRVLSISDRPAEAVSSYEEALSAMQRLSEQDPGDASLRIELEKLEADLGLLQSGARLQAPQRRDDAIDGQGG